MRVLIIGKNSFLGKEAISLLNNHFNLKAISHFQVSERLISWSDVVINFAIHPDFYKLIYHPSIIFDLQFIDLIKKYNKKYIFLSSRKVYSPYQNGPLKESDACQPLCNYGKNKLILENILLRNLKQNVLILRLSNVVGFECIENRNTIMAFILNSLISNDEVKVNTRHETTKDFIPVPMFCHILRHFIQNYHSGIFNVGSGLDIEIGTAIDIINESYGRNTNILYQAKLKDPFLLDISKLKEKTDIEISKEYVFDYFRLLGRKLKTVKNCSTI